MAGLPFPLNEFIPGTKYRFIRVLGEGGQGIVVLANDDFLQVEVVIKLVHAEHAEQLGSRVVDEARALARINHPNIVRVKDGGITAERQPRPFFVMERLHGDTLYAVKKRMGKPFPVRDAINIAIELLDGLDVAHNPPHEMVHRDIKPGNVFMARISPHETRAVLLDFGVARLLAKGSKTMRGFVGTWEYAAPEQINGSVSARSDLYNIGLILYELIAGRHPFAPFCKTPREYAEANLNRVPPRLSALGEINETLDDIVAAALSKDPKKRPRSAHDFGLMLKGLRSSLDMTHVTEAAATTVEEPLQRIMERLGPSMSDTSAEFGHPPSTPLWGSNVSHTDPRAPANTPRMEVMPKQPVPAANKETMRMVPKGSSEALPYAPTDVDRRPPPSAPPVQKTRGSERFEDPPKPVRARSSQGAPSHRPIVMDQSIVPGLRFVRGRTRLVLVAVTVAVAFLFLGVGLSKIVALAFPPGAAASATPSTAPVPQLLPSSSPATIASAAPAPPPPVFLRSTAQASARPASTPSVIATPTPTLAPAAARSEAPRSTTPTVAATSPPRRPQSGLDGPSAPPAKSAAPAMPSDIRLSQ